MHTLLAQQRDQGQQFTAQELRNLMAHQKNLDMELHGSDTDGMSDTATMVLRLDDAADVVYIALFSLHNSSGEEVGRQVRAKVINKTERPGYIDLTASDLHDIGSGKYQFNVVDWTFNGAAEVSSHGDRMLLRTMNLNFFLFRF
jgi:hypothetical protein